MTVWLPSRILQVAVILCLAACLAVFLVVLRQPWIGLTLVGDPEANAARIVQVHEGGPAHGLLGRGHLLAVAPQARPDDAIAVGSLDVIEEPDVIDSYQTIRELFAKQSRLVSILESGPVLVRYLGEGGATAESVVVPVSRPLKSLPSAFWVQLVTGVGSLLIGAWVLALRPRDLPTRLFALTGGMIMLSSFSAAIYSSRELAIDGTLFRILSGLNHLGAVGFGAVMICLFLVYPRRLAPSWVLWSVCGGVALWATANLTHALPNPQMGAQLPTALEMLAIIGLVIAQRIAVRHDPRGRAVLRWLGLSVIVGALPFILLIISPVLFATQPVLQQGHAFGFFLLIYAGLAVGVSHYRLFDLDEWSFRILFYTGGLVLLAAADALLILLLHLQPAASLGLALLVVGFAYLPLRSLLWERLVERRSVADHELFEAVVDISFAGSNAERARRWRSLLQRLFDPMEVANEDGRPEAADIARDGLELLLPAVADSPALSLRYGWSGRRLFGSRDVKLAQQLVRMMRYSEQSRSEFERGRTEERQRIARDLHDDVGARLLSGLHKKEVGDVQGVLRDALADIRSIVGGMSAERLPLSQVLAALRHETGDRLDMAGIEFSWRFDDEQNGELLLDYPVYRSLISLHREVVTNVIRHARASRAEIAWDLAGDTLTIRIEDDGIGMQDPVDDVAQTGNGLRSIRRRIAELGGMLRFEPTSCGTSITVVLPLRAAVDAGGGG